MAKGVYWHQGNKHWFAVGYHNGKAKRLGTFKDKKDAVKAREEWDRARIKPVKSEMDWSCLQRLPMC